MPRKSGPIPKWKLSLEELGLVEEPLDDVLVVWAHHLKDSGWLRDRHRRTEFHNKSNDKIGSVTADDKKNGRIFATMNHQFNLYFEQPDDFSRCITSCRVWRNIHCWPLAA